MAHTATVLMRKGTKCLEPRSVCRLEDLSALILVNGLILVYSFAYIEHISAYLTKSFVCLGGTVTSCQRKYREAPLQYLRRFLVLRCKLDGQYEEVQCQGSTGQCWCVDQDGKELSGTRTTKEVRCPIIGSF